MRRVSREKEAKKEARKVLGWRLLCACGKTAEGQDRVYCCVGCAGVVVREEELMSETEKWRRPLLKKT